MGYRRRGLHDRKRALCYAGAMENWNDLKLVLAIQRAGTLGGGAQALGIDHSTAFRRLNGLEERIGAKLFDRLPNGVYEPTAAGTLYASAAERVENETAALSRAIRLRRKARLVGLSVSCSGLKWVGRPARSVA